MSWFVVVCIYVILNASLYGTTNMGGGQNNRNTSFYSSKYCFEDGLKGWVHNCLSLDLKKNSQVLILYEYWFCSV